jgi:transcriptional regulator with XRE-family HTH domain
MTSKIEFLQSAINTIKLSNARRGRDITEEEIAQKAGLSKEQLRAFLMGEEKIPDDLDTKLLSLYGIKRRTIQFIDPVPPDMLPDLDGEDEE